MSRQDFVKLLVYITCFTLDHYTRVINDLCMEDSIHSWLYFWDCWVFSASLRKGPLPAEETHTCPSQPIIHVYTRVHTDFSQVRCCQYLPASHGHCSLQSSQQPGCLQTKIPAPHLRDKTKSRAKLAIQNVNIFKDQSCLSCFCFCFLMIRPMFWFYCSKKPGGTLVLRSPRFCE